jgi:hypothetical protein
VLFDPLLAPGASANITDAGRPVVVNNYQRGYKKPPFDSPRMTPPSESKRLSDD